MDMFYRKSWRSMTIHCGIKASREPSFESKGAQTLKFRLQYPINGILLSPGGSTAKLHEEIHSLKKTRQNKKGYIYTSGPGA